MPWIDDVVNVIPELTVVPHLRHQVIQEFLSIFGESAIEYEHVAHCCSGGHFNHYITLVSSLLQSDNNYPSPQEYLNQCVRPDSDVQKLTNINIERDSLISTLQNSKFECPDVPEATVCQRVCPACKGTNLQAVAQQMASADEGQTIVYTCKNKKCSRYRD